jgi:hypothetical protein
VVSIRYVLILQVNIPSMDDVSKFIQSSGDGRNSNIKKDQIFSTICDASVELLN